MNGREAVKRGGNEWKTDDGKYHRVYFNDLAELAGLECTYYKTGNVRSARYRGEKISNNKAKKLLWKFRSVKLWWDCRAEEWGSKGLDADEQAELVAAIEADDNAPE
jgi:hypothetical protein